MIIKRVLLLVAMMENNISNTQSLFGNIILFLNLFFKTILKRCFLRTILKKCHLQFCKEESKKDMNGWIQGLELKKVPFFLENLHCNLLGNWGLRVSYYSISFD